MGCTDCRKGVGLPAGTFGTCAICMYSSLAGSICSWLLVAILVCLDVPRTITVWLAALPAFFSIWLGLHVSRAVYLNRS